MKETLIQRVLPGFGTEEPVQSTSSESVVNRTQEHQNAPEGSTHLISAAKDIFFLRDPVFSGANQYENSFCVKQSFYARFLKRKGGWGYFVITDQFAVVHRDGEISVGQGSKFRVKMGGVIAIS